jgi:N-acetylmuramoyl-L-alanine amidase
MMALPNRYGWALTVLSLFAMGASAAASPGQRQRAALAYEKAQEMRSALEEKSGNRRQKAEYKKVVAAYYEVYRLDPAYAKAPLALAAMAELEREAGRQYASDSYLLEAIKSYRFLMDQYPQNRGTRAALFSIGEVYYRDLEDRDEARKIFREYVKKYPASERIGEARDLLRQLSARPAGRIANPSTAESNLEEQPAPLRLVTAVRHWVGPNYLRIVIELGGEAKFDTVRLSNPDRIVVDLQNAHLTSDLVGKTFSVADGFLRQIRVAQFSPSVARVVLDIEKVDSYSIFSLPNPFRLVIDVQGVPPTQVAALKAAPSPIAGARRPAGGVASSIPSASPVKRVAVDTQTPAPLQAQSDPEPSTPEGYEEESPSNSPPPPPKKGKKAKSTAATMPADAPPPIQSAVPTESGSRTLTRALGLKIGRIVIDPGHGGHDTGTIGPTGLEEKDVVLDVGMKLRYLLERYTGCEVVMTRTDDTFIPLEERTAIANEKGADLFISIHANASHDETARGIETYYLNFTSNSDALEVAARENASSQEAVHQLQDLIKKIAMTEKIEESQDFARQVQREVYSRVTKVSGAQRDRGIKKAPFVVLIGANMPSVLAEISFLTNPNDERLLKRSDYREKIANALYQGVLGYLKNLGEVRTAEELPSGPTSTASRSDF